MNVVILLVSNVDICPSLHLNVDVGLNFWAFLLGKEIAKLGKEIGEMVTTVWFNLPVDY